jgi:hypothetical protein
LTSTDLISLVFNEDDSATNTQLILFWWRKPDLIIQFLQFVLFIFAMLVCVVLEFWKDIDKKKIPAALPVELIIMWLVCFSIFIFMMTRAIPKYTLVTNIGQLTNKTILRQVLAKHQLKVAVQKWKKSRKVERRHDTSESSTDIKKTEHGDLASNIASTDLVCHFSTQVSVHRDIEATPSDQRLQKIASFVAKPTAELPKTAAKQSNVPSLSNRFQSIFLQEGFRRSELSVGTMLCFFLVGVRVNALLMLHNASPAFLDIEYSPSVTAKDILETFARVSFWWEVSDCLV